MSSKLVYAVILATVFPIIIFGFQNCSQSNSFRPLSTLSNLTQLPSTFAKQKVQIASLVKAGTARSESVSLSEINLVAKVNTACTNVRCSETTSANGSLACLAVRGGVHPKLEGHFQYFPVTVPPNINTLTKLENSIANNSIDQACLIGVGEQLSYNHSTLSVSNPSTYGLTFNDPNFSNQTTALGLINYYSSYAKMMAANLATVQVGVIDSGISTNADLQKLVINRVSFNSEVDNQYPPFPTDKDENFILTSPKEFHGTYVAGILAAANNNSDSIVGVAQNVQITAYSVGNALGKIPSADLSNAIEGALVDNMDLVNISIGGLSDDPLLTDAIVDAYNSNMIIVTAAGNDGVDLVQSPSYPASYSTTYENVITVGAIDNNGQLAPFSDYNPTTVNILAPGVNITSLWAANLSVPVTFTSVQVNPPMSAGQPPQDHVTISANGTSASAPFVTGAAAIAIGYLKANNITMTSGAFRQLLTSTGANQVPSLAGYSVNGAVLDMGLLWTALTASNIQTTTSSLVGDFSMSLDSSGHPQLNVTVSWTQGSINPTVNSTLGIFDLSSGCNYSSGCLITSVAWPPTKGVACQNSTCTYTTVLAQDQLDSLLSSPTDTKMSLPVGIAIYQTVATSPTISTMFKVFDKTQFNLRNASLPSAASNPTILGQVTSIRRDMQSVHIQGWACIIGSEATTPVRLQTLAGVPITSDFGYIYSDMVPHGTPIDVLGDIALQVGTSGTPLKFAGFPHNSAFNATGIGTLIKSGTHFNAGFESNPALIQPCQIFTASHGFEFIVKDPQLQSQSLYGQFVQVVAGTGSSAITLNNSDGTTNFALPAQPPQAQDYSSLAVQRTSKNYNFTGHLCSSSPNPIELEITFTSVDYTYAASGLASYYSGAESGYVNDSSLQGAPSTPYPTETISASSSTDPSVVFIPGNVDPTKIKSSTYVKSYLNYFTETNDLSLVPSAQINAAWPFLNSSNLAQYVQNLNAHKSFRQVGTKLPVNYQSFYQFTQAGTSPSQTLKFDLSQLGGVDSRVVAGEYWPNYWDYYDVGQQYSNVLVGYDLSTHYSVTQSYMKNTYSVGVALRENKKFETPLHDLTQVVGHNVMLVNWNGNCANGFELDVGPNGALSIPNIGYDMSLQNVVSGFWLSSEQVPSLNKVDTTNALLNVPLTLRFFQDGKLILHLETDSGSNFYQVPYGF
jgi:hypothetical protein